MGEDTSRKGPGDRAFASLTPSSDMAVDNDPRVGQLTVLSDRPEPAPRIAAADGAAAGNGDLAAIIRLQSTELERVVCENERLMSRLDTFLQLHETDQRLRQDLQEQIQRLNERAEISTPAYDVDALRRETRECMIQDIKPVLMAILDLLERSLPEPGEAPGRAPLQPTGYPRPSDELARLPKILTRPLAELTGQAGDIGARRPSAAASLENRGATTQTERPKRQGHKDERDNALPDVFVWTKLFSQNGDGHRVTHPSGGRRTT